MNSAKPNPKQSTTQFSNKDAVTQERTALGPEHAELAKCIGSWDVAFTYWAKDGAEPIRSTGRSIFTPILNSRYIREDYTGEFMGRPFVGIGTLGFDRAAGHYVSVWIDNASTGIMYSTAIPGLAGDELTFEGVAVSPETHEEQPVRHVLKWESETCFTLEFFKGDGEDEVQTMELVYTFRS